MDMIKGLAALAKGDVSREKIIEMNKSGEYQFSPISIVPSAGGIEHNAGELKIFIDDSAAYLENHLPKMDEASVITMLDDVEQVFKWTKATRIKQTGSFEDVKKLFTAEEKRFQTEIIDVLKEKRESFLEALYAEREVKLREYVSEISEASEFEIDSSIFDATIEAKRSTDCAAIKGLRKPVKTLLDGILAVYVAPMIQAKKDAAEAARIEKQKEDETLAFTGIFNLTDSIVDLEALKITAETQWLSITKLVISMINQKIAGIEAKEKAKAAQAAKEAAEKTPSLTPKTFSKNLDGIRSTLNTGGNTVVDTEEPVSQEASKVVDQPVDTPVDGDGTQAVISYADSILAFATSNAPIGVSDEFAEEISQWILSEITAVVTNAKSSLGV